MPETRRTSLPKRPRGLSRENVAVPPKIAKLSAAKQKRLDELLDRNSEGTIRPKEKAELDALVAASERLMVANAKRLAKFAQGQEGTARSRAVPVTVWVQLEAPARR